MAVSLLFGYAVGSPAPAGATFPGVNGSLAYEAPGGTPAIFAIPLGGTPVATAGTPAPVPVRLVDGVARDVHWSPDARQIAFTSTLTGNPEIYTLAVKDPDAVPRQRTFDPALDADPSWSPDGRRIAFTSTRSGNPDIWVMNADGSGLRQLTTSPGTDQQAEFAPTGDRIAFESDRTGTRQIYVMAGDGSGQTQITDEPGFSADANWSPAGDMIAFATGEVERTHIAVVAATGGPVRALTQSLGADQFPAWSPDGHQIAYDTQLFGRFDLHVIDAPGPGGAGGGGTGTDVLAALPFDGGLDSDWGDLPPVKPADPAPATAAIRAFSPQVLVQPPGADTAKPITQAIQGTADVTRQIPLGTKVIATTDRGGAGAGLRVRLHVSLGRRSGTASVDATGGIYRLRRVRRRLDLHLSPPRGCGARAASGPVAVAARPIYQLEVRHYRGRVQTSNRWIRAIGHGTHWLTGLTCRASTVTVLSGRVRVTDLRHNRTVTLRAGQHLTVARG